MAAVKRLLSYLKVVFQTMMKAHPVRGRLKGYDVAVQGSGAAGKWDGQPRHQMSQSYCSSHILPMPLPVHHETVCECSEGRCCCVHSNRGKRTSKHHGGSSSGFQLGHGVKFISTCLSVTRLSFKLFKIQVCEFTFASWRLSTFAVQLCRTCQSTDGSNFTATCPMKIWT